MTNAMIIFLVRSMRSGNVNTSKSDTGVQNGAQVEVVGEVEED